MHIVEVLHSLTLPLSLYDCSLCDTLYTYIRMHMDCISWNSLPSLPSQNVFALVIYCCISLPQILQLKTNKQTTKKHYIYTGSEDQISWRSLFGGL